MTLFRVRAPEAEHVSLCRFDCNDRETALQMDCNGGEWILDLPDAGPGTRYGLRAGGPFDPERGLRFDASKLLVDPRAKLLDRRFAYDPALATLGVDTAHLVPRAIVPPSLAPLPVAPPLYTPGGLIYEVNVRAFTMLHPDVSEKERGTVGALAHPAIIAHLQRLHVSAVELMPIVAWIDERHLPPLGLVNGWGYNPVVPMALDPGLCPGGLIELRQTVGALHDAGIGVILDLVFNHTGESDVFGPTLSFRGLDNRGTYAHDGAGVLINDTGCGNTLDFAQPHVRGLVLETLRHFVETCGIDGFRFDLAPVLGRGPGFSPDAPFFAEIAADPVLANRILIAEPWDTGPGGYQLGQFPHNWLEWNDRFRDDVRHFWRGDGGIGLLATRMAGSSDLFGPGTRTVNFVAAHDGMTLADTVAYSGRHNWANGEENRDGHSGEPCWNCGAEGPTAAPAIRARRAADARALLGTLFASSGAIMLTAGDEFGRTQQGNNNAYCQDNSLTWLDWTTRDTALEAHVGALSAWRAARLASAARFPAEGAWLNLAGTPMTVSEWEGDSPGFAFRSADAAQPWAFRVDRKSRSVEPG